MRYFGPEYMPSEAVFKLISLAKFRGILRLKPGFRHRGFESSTLRQVPGCRLQVLADDEILKTEGGLRCSKQKMSRH